MAISNLITEGAWSSYKILPWKKPYIYEKKENIIALRDASGHWEEDPVMIKVLALYFYKDLYHDDVQDQNIIMIGDAYPIC